MKILFVSLGCDKNLVDTEKMLGILGGDGFQFTDSEEEADVIIINTCCFIGDAKEESVNTILEMARCKEEGRCKALLVTGCLAQRYKDEKWTVYWAHHPTTRSAPWLSRSWKRKRNMYPVSGISTPFPAQTAAVW